MAFIKGLTGCALGFVGGMAVLGLLMPEEVLAATAEVLQVSSAPTGGEAFMRIDLAG